MSFFSHLAEITEDCLTCLAFLQLGGPYIPLKTGRRDGRRSRADILEEYLPDHNESMSVVLERFAAMGIDTPGVVALLGKPCFTELGARTRWNHGSTQ